MPLRGILNQVLGGRRRAVGARRPVGGTTGGVGGGMGTTGMAGGGRRTQDEAIGRGVRTLLSRFRRP
jgi:hypothetical protein